jgi:hypothetical protein
VCDEGLVFTFRLLTNQELLSVFINKFWVKLLKLNKENPIVLSKCYDLGACLIKMLPQNGQLLENLMMLLVAFVPIPGVHHETFLRWIVQQLETAKGYQLLIVLSYAGDLIEDNLLPAGIVQNVVQMAIDLVPHAEMLQDREMLHDREMLCDLFYVMVRLENQTVIDFIRHEVSRFMDWLGASDDGDLIIATLLCVFAGGDPIEREVTKEVLRKWMFPKAVLTRETVPLLLKLMRGPNATDFVNAAFAAMSRFFVARVSARNAMKIPPEVLAEMSQLYKEMFGVVSVREVMPELLTNEEWNRKVQEVLLSVPECFSSCKDLFFRSGCHLSVSSHRTGSFVTQATGKQS